MLNRRSESEYVQSWFEISTVCLCLCLCVSPCVCAQCLCDGDPAQHPPQPVNRFFSSFFSAIVNDLSSHIGISSSDEEAGAVQVRSVLTWIRCKWSALTHLPWDPGWCKNHRKAANQGGVLLRICVDQTKQGLYLWWNVDGRETFNSYQLGEEQM